MINVNWADIAGGGIILAGMALVAYAWCVVAARRIRAQERLDQHRFEADMATRRPSAYDGYDWTPESLSYLADTGDPGWARTGEIPMVPVPPSEVSGPLPVQPVEEGYDPAADAEDFLVKMRRENAEFLAGLGNA